MKTIRFDGYQTTEYEIDGSGTHWVFAQGSSIQTSFAVRALHETSDQSGNIIDINGLVNADPGNYCVLIEGTDTQVNIGEHGNLGTVGLDGRNVSLKNSGLISSVAMPALIAYEATVLNHGAIIGLDYAIVGRNITLVNADEGIIRGGFGILSSTQLDNNVLTVTNHGTIRGVNAAIYLSDGRAVIHNEGIITGDIVLAGGGDDLIDNRIGVVHGTVAGGLGDDLYIVSNANVQLLEKADEGYDTVRSTVSYALHTDFENLQLLGTRDINGSGNAGSNTLTGNSGDNHLAGGRGEDSLAGGLGNDRLTGGGGEDRFVFKGHFGHDVITDFTDGADRLLLWRVEDFSDFKELTRDHLSVSGDGLLIHYGEDSLLIRHMTRAEFDISDIQFAIE